MGRPRKGDKSPRQSGIKSAKADHADGRRRAGESKRQAREREKAENASESPWIVGPTLVRRRASGKLTQAELQDLATQVAKGGISPIDCAIDLFTLQMDVEGARKRDEISGDKYITARRQLLKLKVDVAQAFADKGDPLPGTIKVELVTTGDDATLPQAGDTGDALQVH